MNDNLNCAKPVLDVSEMPNNVAVLKFNVNGLSTWYNYTNMINKTQTDTVLVADAIERLLRYQAERHTDTISHEELGAILHMADIGDVNMDNVEDNSFFIYQKESDCSAGCLGTKNKWIGWNASNHQATSGNLVMSFDADYKPRAISHPSNTDQYYQLGWNAGNKLSYSQPVQFASADGKKQLYIDPNTKQIGYVG